MRGGVGPREEEAAAGRGVPSRPALQVEVVRSARRRKTVQARVVAGVLRLSIPARMSRAEEQHWIAEMTARMERRQAAAEVDLAARAGVLSEKLGLRTPASIRWVENQESRWGSCTPLDGTIRISSRLVGEPPWVIDYVIVHELAHLSVPGHGPRFWSLVDRYPLAERARGFLMARGMEPLEGGDAGTIPGAEQTGAPALVPAGSFAAAFDDR